MIEIQAQGGTLNNIKNNWLIYSVRRFPWANINRTEQYKEQAEKINSRPDKSFAVLTKKRELENYIPKESYNESFKTVDCNSISDWDNEDLPTFFASKTGLKQGEVKSIVNGCLAKQLTKEMLVQLNAFEEIKGWFEKISELYE
mgnify:CR=1 FL=1